MIENILGMNEGMYINKVQSETSGDARHIRPIFDVDKYIKAQKQNGLRYESKIYSNDDHASIKENPESRKKLDKLLSEE